ncbi:TolA-binding protein [Brevundimonas alba]|uniref:TolA-binding protein n=1 Tax=Brevundimonas alba TaxID=74314 RepID=A0A7X5YH84_9CAUL|nr:hypothetical protein [Brevundimonas alba]NJC39915.1 TolA-binding protein [Brevundimonas alba]
MKRTLVIALALATAMPVIAVPVMADAQVLTGRGAPRRAPAPRPRLSEAEQERLFEAEDLVAELEGQIADIQTTAEGQEGGLTAAQSAQVAELTRRREEAQRTVDRLEAKRNR